MPELPEVETSRLGIQPFVEGRVVQAIHVRQPQLRYLIPEALSEALIGQRIDSVRRRAKYLLLNASRGTVIIHLGMSGHLRIVERDAPAGKHDHVDFVFDDGRILRFTDPRRFGLVLWSEEDPLNHKLLRTLGVEPLSADFTGSYLFERWQSKKSLVKPALMDSRLVVGVGNIYASESLFSAGIHPERGVATLSLDDCQRLVDACRNILSRAIEQGGTTLNDFFSTTGKPGYFSQSLQVYGREGCDCQRCGGVIVKIRQQQRSSYYCSKCQK